MRGPNLGPIWVGKGRGLEVSEELELEFVEARGLLANGHPADTPVLVVENCSRSDERILRVQLRDLEAGLAQCSGPVLMMIGAAMAQRDTTLHHKAVDTTTSTDQHADSPPPAMA